MEKNNNEISRDECMVHVSNLERLLIDTGISQKEIDNMRLTGFEQAFQEAKYLNFDYNSKEFIQLCYLKNMEILEGFIEHIGRLEEKCKKYNIPLDYNKITVKVADEKIVDKVLINQYLKKIYKERMPKQLSS